MANKNRIAFITIFLLLILQISTDLYLPSMPAMAHALNTTQTQIQYTLSLFLGGFALSQLFYGPLSDRYGRKYVLLFGMVVFVLMSVVCMLATSEKVLLGARFVQGLGAGGGSVLARAISRDIFSGKALQKLNAYQAMIWSFVPISAPVLGGYIQHYSNWRGNFVFLTLIGLIAVFIVTFLLPETCIGRRRHGSLRLPMVLNHYRRVFCHKAFITNIIMTVGIIGGNMAMSVVMPFLLQSDLGFTPVEYGWIILAVASSFIIGTSLNRILLFWLGGTTVLRIGLALMLVSALLMFTLAISGLFNIWTLVLPLFITQLGAAFIYPNAVTSAQEPFGDIAGICAASIGFTAFAGGMLLSGLMANLPHTNAVSLSALLLSVIVIMIAVRWLFRQLG